MSRAVECLALVYVLGQAAINLSIGLLFIAFGILE